MSTSAIANLFNTLNHQMDEIIAGKLTSSAYVVNTMNQIIDETISDSLYHAVRKDNLMQVRVDGQIDDAMNTISDTFAQVEDIQTRAIMGRLDELEETLSDDETTVNDDLLSSLSNIAESFSDSVVDVLGGIDSALDRATGKMLSVFEPFYDLANTAFEHISEQMVSSQLAIFDYIGHKLDKIASDILPIEREYTKQNWLDVAASSEVEDALDRFSKSTVDRQAQLLSFDEGDIDSFYSSFLTAIHKLPDMFLSEKMRG